MQSMNLCFFLGIAKVQQKRSAMFYPQPVYTSGIYRSHQVLVHFVFWIFLVLWIPEA